MLTMTDAASSKVKEFLAEHGKPEAGLRVRVVGGGCSGFQYQLAVDETSSPEDKVFELDGIKLFVDSKSVLYLNGTEIDYVEGMMGSGFRFNNPNSTGTCGCGESFQV
jgi:iron-sulfur cluster assembly accessory protein